MKALFSAVILMAFIDDAKKDRSKVVDTQKLIDICHENIRKLMLLRVIKQEMFRKKEFQEKAMAIYLLDNTSFGEHGFDLANPKLIEEAINDGRIKPFPRAAVKSDI